MQHRRREPGSSAYRLIGKPLLSLAVGVAFQACAAEDGSAGVPALKVTAPNGATSILIGSLHVAADGLKQPSGAVMQGAKHYVIEHLPGPFADRFIEVAPEVKQSAATRAAWSTESPGCSWWRRVLNLSARHPNDRQCVQAPGAYSHQFEMP